MLPAPSARQWRVSNAPVAVSSGATLRAPPRAPVRAHASTLEAAQSQQSESTQYAAAPQHRRTGASVTKGLIRRDSEAGMLRRADDASLFPFSEPFDVSGQEVSAEAVVEGLSHVLEPERVRRVTEVCAQRTFDVVPIIEGASSRAGGPCVPCFGAGWHAKACSAGSAKAGGPMPFSCVTVGVQASTIWAMSPRSADRVTVRAARRLLRHRHHCSRATHRCSCA